MTQSWRGPQAVAASVMSAPVIAAAATAAALVLSTAATGAGNPAPPVPRPGWSLEQLAAAPDIAHPSVVTTAPDGRIFVAEDPMDIREDVAPDARAGRILCLHPDGRRTIFATGLHAVFGLQYLEGSLYVLHNPRLTLFADRDGIGHDPRDILHHTLPEPWALGWNDHIPANFKLALDGHFYLAVGDKGLFGCTGTDGRRLDLRGGGVVRFRPDGSGLESVATGLRNILDVALNADDDAFTYDNTDEHQWMGRLSHIIEGGFYGYPHDFIPRRPYTLWMMHDFGAGAACGTVCATDDALPASMAGNLFLSDFGKRQITRVTIARDGATWRVTGSEDLLPNPPDDFRPVGIDWSPDGRSLLICDWQHRDHKANATVGRLWKLSWTGKSTPAPRPDWWLPLALGQNANPSPEALVDALGHPARSVRLTAMRRLAAVAATPAAAGSERVEPLLLELLRNPDRPPLQRAHAVWALRRDSGSPDVIRTLRALAAGPDATMATHALRWLSQRRDPESPAASLAPLAHPDARVRLAAAVRLSRLTPDAAGAAVIAGGLIEQLATESDATVRHALVHALRATGLAGSSAWPLIVNGLSDARPPVRESCRFALREVWSEAVIPLLGDHALHSPTAARILGDMVFQPEPYRGTWWAYHPAKSPPPTPATRWSGTHSALAALRHVLAESTTPESRRAAAEALGHAKDLAAIATLRDRLAHDNDPSVRAATLTALATLKDTATAPIVAHLVADTDAPPALRLAAVRHAPAFGPDLTAPLISLLTTETATPLQLAAIDALTPLKAPAAREPLNRLLANGPDAAKAPALRALARFADPSLTPSLLAALDHPDTTTLDRDLRLALAAAPDPRATRALLDSLAHPDPAVTEAARQALATLGPTALPEIAKHLDSLPPGTRSRLRDIFKSNPAASAHPLFASLPEINLPLYEAAGLDPSGDPWRGQQIFFGAGSTSCLACHQIAGHGGSLGPDLTLAGLQFSRPELIESILHPGRVVRDGYSLTTVTTLDGRELTGTLRADTGEGVTLADVAGHSTLIPRDQIADRRSLGTSLMPEGLHAALTPDQFKDLLAFLATRTTDPRSTPAPPLPPEFTPLFNGADFTGWRLTDQNRTHWSVRNGRLVHDGQGGDLWSESDFGDADILVDWRWPATPQLVEFPEIDANGHQLDRTARVLDAGDSGLFLRGHRPAQANFFGYPVGSGEFWEYRESLTGPDRRALTPSVRADAPLGDWNTMVVSLRGDRVSVRLNDHTVISGARLPGLPPRGPIGFQHEHGPLEIRRVAVRHHPAD